MFSGLFYAVEYDFSWKMVKWLSLFTVMGFVFLHGYADETGLRNHQYYKAVENRFVAIIQRITLPILRLLGRFCGWLYRKTIIPVLPLLKFCLKLIGWGIVIAIGCGVIYGIFAFLGSLSVPTLLIIIILILLFR